MAKTRSLFDLDGEQLFDDIEDAPERDALPRNNVKGGGNQTRQSTDALPDGTTQIGEQIAPPNPHRLAFVAALRHYKLADGQFLTRYALDYREADRKANELLRGVASDKPEMTPERWGQARLILQANDPKPEHLTEIKKLLGGDF
jgi:hypothetical protein